VIGIELFARALKNASTIHGINAGQKENKITHYADDTTVFVRDRQSVTQLLKLLGEFKTNCGLEINTSETQALWLGSWRKAAEKPHTILNGRKSLCRPSVSYDEQHSNRINFEEKIQNIEKVLNAWRRRNLTLIGRIKIGTQCVHVCYLKVIVGYDVFSCAL